MQRDLDKKRDLKLAAIDIGSNAVRLQVSSAYIYDNNPVFKKLEYVRFPLRLGHDVFTQQRIGITKQDKFLKLMEAYRLLLEVYETDDYMACATSAMREAENGRQLAELTRERTGLQIRIIDGNKEAEMINEGLSAYITDKTVLHIDVGGGSTELTFYLKGKKAASRSFKLGSVRTLEHYDNPRVWKQMEAWVKETLKKRLGKITAIGTGGNINKIAELAGKKTGKPINISKIEEMKQFIQQFSMEERIHKLQLNPDRADVIIPASDIYLSAMRWAGAKTILVPDVGLKDGMLFKLFNKHAHKIKNHVSG